MPRTGRAVTSFWLNDKDAKQYKIDNLKRPIALTCSTSAFYSFGDIPLSGLLFLIFSHLLSIRKSPRTPFYGFLLLYLRYEVTKKIFSLNGKSTHSTPRSEARDMLRVDTERRVLPRFKNRGLAPSNVSIFMVVGDPSGS